MRRLPDRFVWGVLIVGAALLILWGWATVAWGQGAPRCLPHDALARWLAEAFGETRRAVALNANGAVIELWANRDTGTWTATLTAPGQPSCVIGFGSAWEETGDAAPPAGDPA